MAPTTAPPASPLMPKLPSFSVDRASHDILVWLQAHGLQVAIASAVGVGIYLLLVLAVGALSGLKDRGGERMGLASVIGRAVAKTNHFFLMTASARLVGGYAHPPAFIENTITFLFTIAAVFANVHS